MESLLANISSNSTAEPLLSLFNSHQTNCNTWDQEWGTANLHRFAHLDMQLYQDFYTVWVFLMVRSNAE